MPEYFECKKINKKNNTLHNIIIVNYFLQKTERLLTPPRLCRSRPQSTHDNSPLPARYQNKYDTSPLAVSARYQIKNDASLALPESLPNLAEADKRSRKAECSART